MGSGKHGGPARCNNCGRFVKVSQWLTHDLEKCPNWKPTFAVKSEIEWIVKYTNPCVEQPLN